MDQVYSRVSRLASIFVAALALAGLAAAAWFSTVLARADHAFRNATPDAVAHALDLAPHNTAHLSLRSLQLEYEGSDADTLLERWAALNPLSSAPRIRLGLNAELHGDFVAAEHWLLEAARVDRQFEPAWTLANFYYRHDKPNEFWQWMHAALDISYGDRQPAFELCWRASSDPNEILTRAIPNRREVLSAYLQYLLEEHRAADAGPVAVKLAVWRNPDDVPQLRAACDTLLDSGEEDAAVQVWAALGKSGPFDWRFIASPGVTHANGRILLSGQQPESCELMRQFFKLRAATVYNLRWQSRTSGLPSRTGIEWRVADQKIPVPSSGDWTWGEARFTTARQWIILSLTYKRPLGEARAEGYVEVRNVTATEPQ